MAGVTTTVLVGAAIAGSAVSAREQRKGRKAAEKQNEAARRAEELKAARQRVGALRSQRRQAAAARNQAANAGLQGSSAVAGAIGSLASDTATNIAFGNQLDELGARSLRAQTDQLRAQEQAQLGQTVQQNALRGLSIGG